MDFDKTEWYILTDSGQFGPISGKQMKKIPLRRQFQVWSEGMVDWMSVNDVPAFSQFVSNLPPDSALNQAKFPAKHEIRSLVFKTRLQVSVRRSLLISLVLTISFALVLFILFRPYKFDESYREKIVAYNLEQKYRVESQRIRDESEKIEQLETLRRVNEMQNGEIPTSELKVPADVNFGEKNPFDNLGIVSMGSAEVVPSELIPGFWNYCSGSNSHVYFRLGDIDGSFRSREKYLLSKILSLSFAVFGLSVLSSFLYLMFARKN
jgi:hypothetical protein